MSDELMRKRDELMQDIDFIVDNFFQEFYGEDGNTEIRDELVTKLCDAVCERIDGV